MTQTNIWPKKVSGAIGTIKYLEVEKNVERDM
jgi:hypothetical protein